jgi:hypothetical protein
MSNIAMQMLVCGHVLTLVGTVALWLTGRH